MSAPEYFFPHVGAFVHEWLLLMGNRKVNNRETFWCSQWWTHPEALERLTALWLTWEQARKEPETLSAWWRDHVDHHLPLLMSSSGPFRYCENGQHCAERYEREAFIITPFPEGLFSQMS